jgi:beta-lactam-binding protein with PASTA domain/serine/threonine protein phosphatase PrpC
MGGHAAGEVASRVAIAALEGALEQSLRQPAKAPDFQAALTYALGAAHAAVQARAGTLAEGGNMGTTLTAALVVGNRLWVAHVGDSRAYLLRDGGAEQLTEDQAIPPNRLTQALGMGGNGVVPDVFPRDLQEGDVILLTSDGLHTALRPRDLHLAVRTSSDAQTTCQKLVGAARLRDGSDNITVACLAVGHAFGRSRKRRRRRLALGATLAMVLLSMAVVGFLILRGGVGPGPGTGQVSLDLRVSGAGEISFHLVPAQGAGAPRLIIDGEPASLGVAGARALPDQHITVIVSPAEEGAYQMLFGRGTATRGPRKTGVGVNDGDFTVGAELRTGTTEAKASLRQFRYRLPQRPARVSFNLAGEHGRDVPVVLELVPQGTAEAVTPPPMAGAAEPHSDPRLESSTVAVPSVRGFTRVRAEAALRARRLSPAKHSTSRPDASVPKGKVAGVSPAPGTSVRRDTTVTLIISDGPPPSKPQPAKVPDVVGVQVGNAREMLEKAGLRWKVKEVPGEAPPGQVVRREPGGSRLPAGTVVTLLVSKGPAKEAAAVTSPMVTVPRVNGLPQRDAEKALQAAHLDYTVRKVTSKTVAAGSVIGSEPAEGERVAPDTEVALLVSAAPAGFPLRDVTGRPVGEATRELEEDGLNTVVKRAVSDETGQDRVIGTEPAAGEDVEPGDTIILIVSPEQPSEGGSR